MRFFFVFLGLFLVCLPSLYTQTASNTQPSVHTPQKKMETNQDLHFLCRLSVSQSFSNKEFLNPIFEDAELSAFSGKQYKVKARFNIHQDEMQIFFNEKIYVLYPHLIDEIQLNGIVYSPKMIQMSESEHYAYLKKLVNGKMELLQGAQPSTQQNFYVHKGDSTQKLKLKRKSVLAVFEDKSTQISRFLAEKDLNIKEIEDLKRIFEYYNSL